MNNKIIMILVLLVYFNSSFISADIISINSGGGDIFIIHPNKYVDRIFFGSRSNVTTKQDASSGGIIKEKEEIEKKEYKLIYILVVLIILITMLIIIISRKRKLFLLKKNETLDIELT